VGEKRVSDSQFETFVTDVVPIVDVLRIEHRRENSTSHVCDVDRFWPEVEIFDSYVSEYYGSEDFDRLLTRRSTTLPSSSRCRTRSTNNLDSVSDIIESLLLRLNWNSSSCFSLEIFEFLDVDSESSSKIVVVSAYQLNDFSRRDDTESTEDDSDWNIFMNRVVLEIDLAVFRENVRFRFSFVG
jgi:hypothetical protein